MLDPDILKHSAADGFRLPSPNEVKAALAVAGLTGEQAANLIGVDLRTIRRWTSGERHMPYPAWRLLLLETGIVRPLAKHG